ncbi:hypothetical protein [Azospirillum halopraeferens]|uniref:hypothetical protein n=1 Tax=Azospirillum halopraeferens TaxID=34010 RepID=UPI00040E80AE|nr:hypothetical protein [Azospirillum halopraeferens]
MTVPFAVPARWSVDDRIDHRHQAARRRIAQRVIRALDRRRTRRRGLARAALAVAVVVLGVLLVGVGRKAAVLIAAPGPASLPLLADGPSFG